MKLKKELRIVLVIMALIAMVMVMSGCGEKDKDDKESKKSNFETPISNYFNGMEKADLDTYKKAYPDFYNDSMDIDEDDMENMHEKLEDEYGKDLKISYEITSNDDIKEEDIKNVQEYISLKYNEDVKVSEGKEVKIKATIKGSEDSDTDTARMYVYNIDGEWKILNTSPSAAKSYINIYK